MLILLLFFAIALLAAFIEVCQSRSQLSEVGEWIETSPAPQNSRISQEVH